MISRFQRIGKDKFTKKRQNHQEKPKAKLLEKEGKRRRERQVYLLEEEGKECYQVLAPAFPCVRSVGFIVDIIVAGGIESFAEIIIQFFDKIVGSYSDVIDLGRIGELYTELIVEIFINVEIVGSDARYVTVYPTATYERERVF